MAAQIVRHDSQVSPGGGVTYSIWVWSTVPATNVVATASSDLNAMRRPRFTLCPDVRKTTCSIGSLPANQATELLVTDRIRSTATIGEQITLTMTVQAKALSPAEATVTTVVGGQPSPSPTPSLSLPPTLPPSTLPGIPTTLSPSDLSSLFPVITPTPQQSPTDQPQQARGARDVTASASALPFSSRLIGGQLAGLAVLAAAVTMVVARLSLRTPKPQTPRSVPDRAGHQDAGHQDDNPTS